MSLTNTFIHCCYVFRQHMGHHQATFYYWEDHCTVHFVTGETTALYTLLLGRPLHCTLCYWGDHCTVHFVTGETTALYTLLLGRPLHCTVRFVIGETTTLYTLLLGRPLHCTLCYWGDHCTVHFVIVIVNTGGEYMLCDSECYCFISLK
jgi:hypothetical protein